MAKPNVLEESASVYLNLWSAALKDSELQKAWKVDLQKVGIADDDHVFLFQLVPDRGHSKRTDNTYATISEQQPGEGLVPSLPSVSLCSDPNEEFEIDKEKDEKDESCFISLRDEFTLHASTSRGLSYMLCTLIEQVVADSMFFSVSREIESMQVQVTLKLASLEERSREADSEEDIHLDEDGKTLIGWYSAQMRKPLLGLSACRLAGALTGILGGDRQDGRGFEVRIVSEGGGSVFLCELQTTTGPHSAQVIWRDNPSHQIKFEANLQDCSDVTDALQTATDGGEAQKRFQKIFQGVLADADEEAREEKPPSSLVSFFVPIPKKEVRLEHLPSSLPTVDNSSADLTHYSAG